MADFRAVLEACSWLVWALGDFLPDSQVSYIFDVCFSVRVVCMKAQRKFVPLIQMDFFIVPMA